MRITQEWNKNNIRMKWAMIKQWNNNQINNDKQWNKQQK